MHNEYVSCDIGEGYALLRVNFQHDLSAPEQDRAAGELMAAAGAVKQPLVIVDLSGMDVAYSSFLGALLSVLRRQRQHGGRMLLASMRPLVEQAVRRCALDVLFECFPSVDAALGARGAASAVTDGA